jgi:hypothetical protein
MIDRSIQPNMPAHSYKTYEVRQPLATHFRPASCVEVDCQAYANGWISTIDVSTELGQKQANYIRLSSGRHYAASENGTAVTFHFASGQACFTTHHIPLGRPQLFVVRGGDFRGNPRGEVFQRRPDDWVDDFANHQQVLADRLQEG